MMLKGRQKCFLCPKMQTITDEDLDTYYPNIQVYHECHYTECDVTKDVEDRTINKHCPLWVNQWPE